MRLVLTYLVTVVGVLYVAHRFLRPLKALTACFLTLVPALFLGEAFATNGVYAPLDIAYHWQPLTAYREQFGIGQMRTPLLVDVVDQHIPWRKAVREALKHGRLPLWNRFQLAGEPLLAVQMPGVLWPAVWLAFVLPLAQAWTFDMAFRIFLALLAAYLFLRDLDCSEVAACFGATAWALCDFLMFALGYPHGAAAAALPLLVMGLRRIAHRQNRSGTGLAILAICVILAAGHPETSLHAIAAAGFYFLILLFGQARGHRLGAAARATAAGVLGLMLMAVTIVPFLEVLPHTLEYSLRKESFARESKSVPVSQSLASLEAQLVPYVQGVSGHSRTTLWYESAAYPGLLVLALAGVGLCIRHRDRLALVITGIVSMAVALGVRGVADLVSKLPLFDIALNQRLVFIGAFVVAMLAGIGLDAILRGSRWQLAIGMALGVAVLTGAVFLHRRNGMLALQMPQRYMYDRLALQLVPVLAFLALAASRASRNLLTRGAWALPFALAAVRYGETGRLYPVAPAKAFYPPLDVLSPINRQAPYRFAAFGMTFIPNMAALYELEDIRAYEAMTLGRLVATFPLWCIPQPVWFNRVDDPTKPFLSFLNVRYFLVPPDYGVPPGWRLVKTSLAANLLENERVLPRAFIPRRVFCGGRDEEQLAVFKSIQDFSESGVVEAGCPAPTWLPNGRAEARITKYRADALDVGVVAESPTLLATSIVGWPGWQAEIDGRPAKSVFYNHAFLGVWMPSGRHVVTLRYLPVGVLAGGVISGLAFLLAGIRLIMFGAHPTRRSPLPNGIPSERA